MVRSKCSSVSSSKLVDVLLEGRVVDQDVELAEARPPSFHGVLAEFGIGHVAREQDAAAAFLLHGALGFLGVVVLVEIGDRHVGALARVQHGHRAADTGIAAGDQRDLVLELLGALVMRRVVHRRELEFRFVSGLLEMLLRQRRCGIDPRARLHRLRLCLTLALLLVSAVDLALDGTLLLAGLFRFFLEGFGA